MNILYTLNDKFVPQVAASICSICENNISFDEIHFFVISNGITDDNKSKIIKFIEKYNRKVTVMELKNINDYFDFEFDTSGWNPVILARLALDKFIPNNIDKILYLDGDTIIRGNLSDLWKVNLDSYVIGASIEPTIDKKRRIDLGLEKYPYYNSGVLLINLKKWREENIGNKIIDFYRKNNKKMFAPDQDALNCFLKDEIYTLSPKYNFYNIFYQYNYKFLSNLLYPVQYISSNVYEDAVKDPIIIHYLGEERPWRKGNYHKYKKDYLKYLSLTPWNKEGIENGWNIYFICFYIFNFVTKPFPTIRYKIINYLIPTFMKYRAKQLKKSK